MDDIPEIPPFNPPPNLQRPFETIDAEILFWDAIEALALIGSFAISIYISIYIYRRLRRSL